MQILGMGERQVEELRDLVLNRAIVPGPDGGIRNEPRMSVGRIHTRRAAKRIARKLIEQNNERQRAVGIRSPIGEFAPRGRLVRRKEALAEALVEGVVLCEPVSRTGRAPERDDRARLVGNPGLGPGRLGNVVDHERSDQRHRSQRRGERKPSHDHLLVLLAGLQPARAARKIDMTPVI